MEVRIVYIGFVFDFDFNPCMRSLGFRTGSGDCYVMASTFYWIAKEAGYNAHYVTGYVNKGKTKGPHAWVEIKIKNKTYVYDPNFQKEFGPKGYTG